ncbi:hypothetical protein F4803DRAFT_335331 [Xylaria telfairii]|nr:hypothetical protein F4803DRAFT_335331 [Xylaria telfairii]
MAYYTTIWADARKDHSKRYGVPGPTIGSVVYGLPPQYFSIPVNPSPRSRPFRAFENSVPTPPGDSARLAAISAAERAHAAYNATWWARQLELYLMPGAEITAEMRLWNGRRVPRAAPESILASLPAVAMFLLDVLATAVRVEILRRRAAGRARLGRGYYHVLQIWRAVAIEMGFIIARLRLIALIMFSTWALFFVMLRTVIVLDDDQPLGEIEYYFVKDCRSWSVVAS